jgi:hypothetical protein
MDEKSLPDQISQLMNDTPEIEPDSAVEKPDEQKDILIDSLKAVAGQSDGALEAALDDFMNGKGILHETTRSALTRGGTGLSDVITLLVKQFKLSPAVAKMIASLILKMQPSGSQDTAKESTTKKKPRRKTKPKAASAAKKKTSSSKKKKKKTTAKPKKTVARKKVSPKTKPRSSKKTTTKPAAKKKPAAKTGKKKTTARAKPKKAKRTRAVEIPE